MWYVSAWLCVHVDGPSTEEREGERDDRNNDDYDYKDSFK